MRRIKIEVHPLSVAIGIACAVAVSFAASPAQSPITALAPNAHRIAIVGPVTIDGIYDPREAVVVREGTPYSVPAGKLLVLTGLGRDEATGSGNAARLLIDGIQQVGTYQSPTFESSVRPLPPGLTASAGSMVVADDGSTSNTSGRAWGYLVDA